MPTTTSPRFASTQEHILVQSVRDQVIILHDGLMAAVVEVEGIDLTRLSDDGLKGLIIQYENFLLTLRFDYQIVIARKRQRLEEYLAYADGEAQKRAREGNKAYARALHGWINFMMDVVRQVNPQAPLYLFVLPYQPTLSQGNARGAKTLTLDAYRRGLNELKHRTDQVIRGLTRIGLGSRRLTDQELVAVLHRSYHPSMPDYRVPPTIRLKSLIARVETEDSAPKGEASGE